MLFLNENTINKGLVIKYNIEKKVKTVMVNNSTNINNNEQPPLNTKY